MSGWNFGLAMPEWILSVSVLVVLFLDARTPHDRKRGVARAAALGVLLATAWALVQGFSLVGKHYAFQGHYGADSFSAVFKGLFGITSLIVMAMSGTWLERVDRGHGEFRILALLATLGMFFVASVEDFATLFVSLELITVSFYCLTAFKRNDERAVEAGVKYVILGALASAFLLMGIAFLYGATGSLWLRDLSLSEATLSPDSPQAILLTFGMLLTLVGLGFKVAAVPFQVWTPDVYQGAATPVTAFLSMGSKAAGFVLLLKVIRAGLGPGADAGLAITASWVGLIALLAGATVLYGNLGAIWQGDIKRLLGYSSIGHAGYMLMGIMTFNARGFAAVLYYLMAYLFTVLAVFAVVVIVNGVTRSHKIDAYSGLGRKSPFLALVMTVGLLSLAGVPPLAGFFGKFLLFMAVIAKGTVLAYTIAFIAAAAAVISLYYYLCVVKRLYIYEPAEGAFAEPFRVTRSMKLVLWICLIGMFVLGVFVRPFLALAEHAAGALVAAG